MADSYTIWQWLSTKLDNQEPAALLIVTNSVGSSPGKIGAKMASTATSSIGTIGGGMIEASLIKTARALLKNGNTEPQIVRRAHRMSQTIKPSGMICGGEQTVLIYPFRYSDKAVLDRLLLSYQRNEPNLLRISAQGIGFLPLKPSESTPKFNCGEDWYYQESLGRRNRAFIIGGGHVSVALSKVLDMLEFDITVIDDRQADILPANPHTRKIQTFSYSGIEEHIPEGKDVFVFIMTHLHQTDELVLAELAGKQLAYLGLLGSSQKIDCIKRNLTRQHPNVRLQNVYAPVGLPIGSHTPEEIAISIGAEVIKTLNAKSSN